MGPNATLRVLEDNDPTGYMSNDAVALKTTLRIEKVSIPPHRPDLNVLDFSIWDDILKRVNDQNRRLCNRRASETREAYIGRLVENALSTDVAYVGRCIKDYKRRARALVENGGDLVDK